MSATIAGSGFIPASTAQWNGAPLATTYSSATTLGVTLPASDLANGTVAKLTVVNPSPGGGTSSAVDFLVNNPVPAISRINPTSVVAGSGDTLLNVSGSGFVVSTVITWNGAALAGKFVSATEFQATVPAANLSGSSEGAIAAQNPAPGGGTSAATKFDVNSPAPLITAISPRIVPPGSAATIAITGTGFEANSVVLWNGKIRPTTYESPTQLKVALSATDLQTQELGALQVSNPGPGASNSTPTVLTVTSLPVPVIQSVSIASAPGQFGGCPQLQVVIAGTNLSYGGTIQANGVSFLSLPYSQNPTTISGYLPLGFASKPGALSFTVTNQDGLPVTSDPFPYPSINPPVLALCANPSPATVFLSSSFSFAVQPSEVNVSGNGTVTLGSLPAGVTSTSTSVPLPPTGATVHLKAANSVAAGTYDLTLNGTAGSAMATGDFNFTVSTAPPPTFFFVLPFSSEMGIPIGGTGSLQYNTFVNGSGDYDVTPSVTGLPPGTTATFSPTVFTAGQSVTITLAAASNAPVTQNASVTLIGTPSAPVASVTTNFFADVTQPPGSLPGNRTDFVATAGTPFAAAYDATHNLIFSSNPDWNRIDVISNVTHKIVKSIPVRAPRGLDITQDNSQVWVQTASPNVYAINTASFQTSHYSLPDHSVGSSGLPLLFSTDRLLALSDGTLFLFFNDSGSTGSAQPAVWNPQTNQINVLNSGPISAWGVPVRSGDGTRVYSSNDTYATGVEMYDVSSRTVITLGQGTNYPPVAAVNHNGSKLVLGTGSTLVLYDSNLSMLGTVPGALTGFGTDFPLDGGLLFSSDNTKLYEVGVYNGLAVVLTIDASTLNVLGTAPSAPTNPVGTSGAAGTATPFAIDSAGIIIGLQNFGISFDDSTFYQNYVINQPGFHQASEYIATYAGPLAGGAVSSLLQVPSLIPDVWFGQTRGSADISQGLLTFTSPPSATPGPVNVKFIFPDGEQEFYPQLFSYGTFPAYAVTSGSSPDGGAPAQVVGYGLPQDVSGGTVTVGPNTATITTMMGQYPPLSGEPYPSTILAYTFPPGAPGRSDLQVTTPIGSGTLPKAIFYAKSVTDYASADTFTAVLVDQKRHQVYLSAGDHVDVFSATSNQFLAPLQPAAQGSQKLFAGLALTPDGSQLLAADLIDGSLAVINPDSPANTYAIPVAPTGPGVNGCAVGPLYVAATSTNLVFVTTGSLPHPSCPPYGGLYIANLQTHTAAPSTGFQCLGAIGAEASSDGNFVALGGPPCIYSAQTASYAKGQFPMYYGSTGIAISADGNVIGSGQVLGDLAPNIQGIVPHPIALFGPTIQLNPPKLLLEPRLNASGSLYYFAYPNYFEIADVAHATLRMRFALTQTIQDTATPLAIDSGGRFVYLLTDKGLTVVDFGAALLSIGHLSQQNASPGSQVVVRGSGFDSSTTATVGGIPALVSVTDENTLMLTVPAARSGAEDIVLMRSDGETYTLENSVVLP